VVVAPAHRVSIPVVGTGNASTFITLVVRQPVGNVYVIMVVPAFTPVMLPLTSSASAILSSLLLHVPPPTFDKVAVAFTHTLEDPEIAEGSGFTLITAVAVATPQLLLIVYVTEAVPTAIPETTPVEAPIVAIDGLLLVQLPPKTVLDSVAAEPWQTDEGPIIEPETAEVVTDTLFVDATRPQEVITAYDMVTTPAAIPVTFPEASTVAIPSSLLLHVPPETVLASGILSPVHTLDEPVNVPAVGAELIVTVVVTKQPEDAAYEIVAVPTPAPVTTPVVALTVATEGVLLDHVPPAGELLSVVPTPTQVVAVPVMPDGSEFTLTVTIRAQPVDNV
jgi:hypothetical protein